MGTDLFALRKRNIQLENKDNTSNNDENNYLQIDSYQIWSDWLDFDWPESLHYFWWKIHDYDSAQYYSKTIRKYYPMDTELIKFADWLGTFNTDIIFKLSI